MAATAQVTPLVISYDKLLIELAAGTVAIGTLDTALYFLDCTQKHFFDEAIALEKLNTNQTLTQRQKWLVHQQLCTSVGVAIEKGRAVWRNGPEGTWPELNWLLELNGLPQLSVPFYDDIPVMRHYAPEAVVLAIRCSNLAATYKVFPTCLRG